MADLEELRPQPALGSRLITRVHRTCAVALGAATIVAALGLSGCGGDSSSAPIPTTFALSKPPTVPAPPLDTGAPLPPPTTLTDLMNRLADPAVPGSDKVGLVQYGTPADGGALDRFAKALHDSGYAPLIFVASDLTWAQDQPGNILGNVTIKANGPHASKDLKFPMEFSPEQNSWQLTRKTADMLLQIGNKPSGQPPAPSAQSTPSATPTP